MKTSFLKTSCLILLVVVAFVYFANPIYTKASTADMDYIETDMTTSEVAELFAVPAAFLPAALVIIGFIVLTYCTLRNIQVPVSYSSQATFLDKCTQLGQYVVDNITDPIKDFLYSVYTYAEDNNLTSVTGIAAFTAVHIGQFFHAIGQWINGSLINNVSSVGQGLLDNFVSVPTSLYSVYSGDVSGFISHSNITPQFGILFTQQGNNIMIGINRFNSVANVCAVVFNNGFACYTLNNGVLSLSSSDYFLISDSYNFSRPSNVSWSFQSYANRSYFTVSPYSVELFFPNFCWTYLSTFYAFCTSCGFSSVYSIDLTTSSGQPLPSTLTLDDVNLVQTVVATPWSDQIYQPSDDELEIDPDGIGEVLGGALAGLTLGELINLLTQGKTLTLDSALESQKIVGGGDYVFPSMDSIWKYPQYFFDMLKGWGTFVGGCLSAVTVGDGGLSWIFYGGFVLLICGGIIGKILLG